MVTILGKGSSWSYFNSVWMPSWGMDGYMAFMSMVINSVFSGWSRCNVLRMAISWLVSFR